MRQLFVYLNALSLGMITFYRTSDKNVLFILSVSNDEVVIQSVL